jgi:hypothetical protein
MKTALSKNTSILPVRRLLFWLMCTILAAFLLVVFIRISGVNNLERARFGDMVYGTAYRPYVTRALLPGMVRLLTGLISPQTYSAWSSFLETSPPVNNLLVSFKAGQGLVVEAIISWLLMLVSLLGFCAAFRRLLETVYCLSPLLVDLCTLLSLLGLLPFFGYGYIYDFTTLFLFTLQLAQMVRRQWLALLLTFPFTVFNKETAILLLLILAFYGWKHLPFRKTAVLVGCMAAIFIAVRFSLGWVFSSNPGAATEYHLPEHIMVIQKLPVLAVAGLAALILLTALVLQGWKNKPVFLCYALVILLPLAGLFIFYGFPFEFRAMYEVYPIILALVIPTVGHALHIRVS